MYDTIIIGGGPAGYLAAERLGHHKKSVLLIEEQHLGGTCLNVGCIPTKTLINSAKLYTHAKEGEKFGIKAEGVSYDWNVIQNWKNDVVSKLRGGIESQMKKYGIELINGRGEILSPPSGGKPAKVRSVTADGTAEHEGKTLLVCTGSVNSPSPIPGIKDNPLVVDSTGLLSVESVPKRLAVLGGGVIGIEFAGIFSAFGSEVSVFKRGDEIINLMDREQAPLLRRAMKGIEFNLGSQTQKIENSPVPEKHAEIHYTDKKGDAKIKEADLILLSVGRQPLLDSWGAEAAGIAATPKGVTVDDRMRTNVNGIWAAGDVTGKSLLAHSAYRMAEVAVADILTVLDESNTPSQNLMRYDSIPWVVYGITEAAGVGITEQEAAAQNISILKATLPMRVSGRFVAENTIMGQGAVKVLADAKSRRILGLHAVGAYASEFIWGGTAIIEKEFTIEDTRRLIFPHPTVCELIRDAVWALE